MADPADPKSRSDKQFQTPVNAGGNVFDPDNIGARANTINNALTGQDTHVSGVAGVSKDTLRNQEDRKSEDRRAWLNQMLAQAQLEQLMRDLEDLERQLEELRGKIENNLEELALIYRYLKDNKNEQDRILAKQKNGEILTPEEQKKLEEIKNYEQRQKELEAETAAFQENVNIVQQKIENVNKAIEEHRENDGQSLSREATRRIAGISEHKDMREKVKSLESMNPLDNPEAYKAALKEYETAVNEHYINKEGQPTYHDVVQQNLNESLALLAQMEEAQKDIKNIDFEEALNKPVSSEGKSFEQYKAEMEEYNAQIAAVEHKIQILDEKILQQQERVKLHQMESQYASQMEGLIDSFQTGKISYAEFVNKIPQDLKDQSSKVFGREKMLDEVKSIAGQYGIDAAYIDSLQKELQDSQITLQARANIINAMSETQTQLEKTLDQEKILRIELNGSIEKKVIFSDENDPNLFYTFSEDGQRLYADNPEDIVAIKNKLEEGFRPGNENIPLCQEYYANQTAINQHTQAYEHDIEKFKNAEKKVEDAQKGTDKAETHDIPAPAPDKDLQNITDHKNEMVSRIGSSISEAELKTLAREYGIPESHFEKLKQALTQIEPGLQIKADSPAISSGRRTSFAATLDGQQKPSGCSMAFNKASTAIADSTPATPEPELHIPFRPAPSALNPAA